MSFKLAQKQRGRKLVKKSMLTHFTPYDVIQAPLMTEKAYKLTTDANKYYFKIHKDANKNDVRHAVIALYGVTPVDVNTSIMPLKGRANRATVRSSYKKAVVTLKK